MYHGLAVETLWLKVYVQNHCSNLEPPVEPPKPEHRRHADKRVSVAGINQPEFVSPEYKNLQMPSWLK